VGSVWPLFDQAKISFLVDVLAFREARLYCGQYVALACDPYVKGRQKKNAHDQICNEPSNNDNGKAKKATNPHDLLDQESVKLQLTPHFKSLEAFIPKVGTSKNTQESAVLRGGKNTVRCFNSKSPFAVRMLQGGIVE
jgi:hypothetical protein